MNKKSRGETTGTPPLPTPMVIVWILSQLSHITVSSQFYLTVKLLKSDMIFVIGDCITLRIPRVRKIASSNSKGRPNLTKRCKRFVSTSTSIQVAVLPWRYNAEMGTANLLHASAWYGEYHERFGLAFIFVLFIVYYYY